MAYRERHDYTVNVGASTNIDTDIPIRRETELEYVDVILENTVGSGDLTIAVARLTTGKLRVTLTEGGTDQCQGRATITLVHSIQR